MRMQAFESGRKAVLILFILLISTFTVAFMLAAPASPAVHATGPTIPSGIQNYVPVTLTNTQSSAVLGGTQVMVLVNWASSTISSYEGTNLQNVRWFDSAGNVLNAWMENGTSSSTKSAVWMKLNSSGIAADSSIVIYLGFDSTSTNDLSTNGPWGAYPTYTSTYGQYDDGAVVFVQYQNFAGNSCPSGQGGWSCSAGIVNNGLEFTGLSEHAVSTNTYGANASQIMDAYVNMTQRVNVAYGSGLNSFGVSGGTVYWCISLLACGYSSSTLASGSHVLSVYYADVYSPGIQGSEDYGEPITEALSFGYGTSTEPLYISSSQQVTVTWMRLRAYPPNGVMPTELFDEVQVTLSATPYSLPTVMTVDGTNVSLPAVLDWTPGASHTLTAVTTYDDSAIPCSMSALSSGCTVHFSAWSGLSTSTSTSISITQGSEAGVYVANYLAASTGLALDGSSTFACRGCGSGSMQLQVTQNDVAVVQIALSPPSTVFNGEGYWGAFLTSLTGTSPSMTFTQRYAYTAGPTGDGSMIWEDYAVAPATGLATITATMNSSVAAWTMIGYSVMGANTAAPWDTNSMLATGAQDFNDCNLVDGCGVSFSTTNPNTFVIFGLGSEANVGVTPPSGFTLIQRTSDAAGWETGAVAGQIFISAQTDASTGSWVLSAEDESAVWFADAIQASTPTSTTTSLTTTLTTSSTPTSVTTSSSTTSTTTPTTTFSTTTSTGSTSSTATLNTYTFTVSSQPLQSTIGGIGGIQVSYTNTYSQSISAFVWVTVKNSAGQAVGVFVGSVEINPGSTLSAFVPTFNLPSGKYTATVFATTQSFVAISIASYAPLTF